MTDDELDPAFLDLDLAAHASSLGAEFGGSSLYIDRLDDSFEAKLGAGFRGATLGDELQFGGETLNGFEGLDPDAARTRSVHLADDDDEDDGDDDENASWCDDDDAVRTPSRQKRARVRTNRQHQSLAFELASVARPSRERTLLSELGLEDDDEEEAGGSDKSDVSACESEGSVGVRLAGNGARAPLRRQNGLARLDGDHNVLASPRRRTATNGRRAIPSSLEEDADRFREVEQDAKRERALEQDLEAAAADLSDSTRDILEFMNRLRIHVGASSSEPTTSTTISTAASTPPFDYRDRQSAVEDLCSAFLRSLQSSATRRTEQGQDLTVLERELARSDVGWQHALGGLDPLPHDLFDDYPAHDPLGDHLVDEAAQVTHYHDSGLARPARTQDRADSTATVRASITSELASLRSTTQSLLSILASLAEQTQVQSALTSDAGRKLRALRTQLGTLKDEAAHVEPSEAFVGAYERARQDSRGRLEGTRLEGKDESAAAMARREVAAVQQRLESGWLTAQKILTSCA